MKITQLLKALLPYEVTQEYDDLDITSIEMNSKHVKPGSLFVCLEGFQTDGHLYAQKAVDQGAIAILAQRPLDLTVPVIIVPDTRRALAFLAATFYGNPTAKLRLIGVTGTNGKTTITHLLEQIFEDLNYSTGRIGTVGIRIGDTVTEVDNTTPESSELQKAFAQMVEHNCQYGFMEVSSHAIHMGRVRGCHFRSVIFTNLTQDHLDYHGTMDEYKRAKGLIFAQLGNDYDEEDPKVAILNADDAASEYYKTITPAHVLTYGIDTPNVDVKATNIRMTSQGMNFTVESFKGQEEFHVQLLGKFNIYNLLAATTAGLVEGISLGDIKRSLEQVKGVRGRVEPVDAGQEYTVIVDYAHTPDSLKNVLQTIREFAEQRVICVIGCGGDRDRTKRPIMAQIAAQYADFTILTSDNPRTEDPEQILEDMRSGLQEAHVSPATYTALIDRREAIHEAIALAQAGDVILIAGKGHETYQLINGQKLHFDDREVALEAIHKYKNN